MLLYLRHNMLMTHLLMRHIDLVRVWSRNVASSLCKMTHIGLSSSAMNASAGEDCSHPHVEDLVPNLIRDYISGHDDPTCDDLNHDDHDMHDHDMFLTESLRS